MATRIPYSRDGLHLHQERTYRQLVRSKMETARVTVQETDLSIHSEHPANHLARESVIGQRGYLEAYIRRNPAFQHSLVPLAIDPLAPPIVQRMISAGRAANVGPMAAVAGALSEQVGMRLLQQNEQVIVENGGDVFFEIRSAITIALYAGQSPLSLKIGLRVTPEQQINAVCTSSATVGHSLSKGHADAACVLSDNCALADAVATAVGNRVQHRRDIQSAIQWGQTIEGVKGILIVVGENLGAWGQVEMVAL